MSTVFDYNQLRNVCNILDSGNALRLTNDQVFNIFRDHIKNFTYIHLIRVLQRNAVGYDDAVSMVVDNCIATETASSLMNATNNTTE